MIKPGSGVIYRGCPGVVLQIKQEYSLVHKRVITLALVKWEDDYTCWSEMDILKPYAGSYLPEVPVG